MIRIVGGEYAIEVGQKDLVLCRLEQERLINTLKEGLRVMPDRAPQTRMQTREE
jgi:hypothetical protein